VRRAAAKKTPAQPARRRLELWVPRISAAQQATKIAAELVTPRSSEVFCFCVSTESHDRLIDCALLAATGKQTGTSKKASMEAVKTIVRDTLSSPFLERLFTFGNQLLPQQSSTNTAATYVLIMASLLLVILFMAIVVILATSSSSNFNSNNKATSTADSSTSASISGAHAFSTFVQTRLQQSKQQARSRQQALVRLLENSKLALRAAQARDSSSSNSNWWEDLSPSAFRLLLPEEEDALFFDDDVNEELDDAILLSDSSETLHTNTTTLEEDSNTGNINNNSNPSVTHFCFLVHGHRGLSRDLSYFQAVMRRRAAAAQQDHSQKLVVHSVTCNEKQTDDGVAAGGERLVDEMLTVIREHMMAQQQQQRPPKEEGQPLRDITISMLGNSLGGLYSRYAIAKLKERCRASCKKQNGTEQASNDCYILDDAFAVHLNIFCTTATPHLGVAGHTFLPLPRRAEIGVAHAMGQSGKDLFRLNPLLFDMATNETFLEPLAAFRKRIAYANAYGTDFPVPAATAAFLSESSAYPHHVADTKGEPTTASTKQSPNGDISASRALKKDEASESSDDTAVHSHSAAAATATKSEDNNPLVVATLHTRSVQECDDARGYYESSNLERSKRKRARMNSGSSSSDGNDGDAFPSEVDERNEAKEGDMDGSDDGDSDDDMLAHMSTSLDSLGWKKVFVDMRKGVPKISIPKSIPKVLRGAGSYSTGGGVADNESNSSADERIIEESDSSSSPASFDAGSEVQPPPNVEPIHRFKPKGILSSKEVAASVLTTALPDEEMAFHWPMGHNMIVAFSRSRWSTKMYKAGRPVVDALAKELVEEIFAFEKAEAAQKEAATAE